MEPEWNCLLLGGFVLLVFEVKSLYEARAVKLIKLLLTLLYISVSPLVMAGVEVRVEHSYWSRSIKILLSDWLSSIFCYASSLIS